MRQSSKTASMKRTKPLRSQFECQSNKNHSGKPNHRSNVTDKRHTQDEY